MVLPRPRAIYFDWDGTLVDSLGFVFDAHNHVRTHFGLPLWSEQEFKVNMIYSSKEIYPGIYKDKTQEAFQVLEKFGNDHYENYVSMFPDTAAVLRMLAPSGIRTGLISNMRDAMLQKQVDFLNLRAYFEIVAGGGYAAKDKPAADPLLKALKERGLQAGDDIWYVGDTETDLMCATNAGCKAVFLTHGKDRQDLIQAYNPAIVVNDIGEFRRDVLVRDLLLPEL